MAELSDLKRKEYGTYSPVLWRNAVDSVLRQTIYFEAAVSHNRRIIFVSDGDIGINGFIIAAVVVAPPVYNPGGRVCMVDDYLVSSPELWPTVGQSLLRSAFEESKKQRAVLSVVVCGHLDKPKRSMLRSTGAAFASEWYATPPMKTLV